MADNLAATTFKASTTSAVDLILWANDSASFALYVLNYSS
jgi:hypothetical protein